jgi:hypothetical protein
LPLAELRLRIPFAAPSGKGGRAYTASAACCPTRCCPAPSSATPRGSRRTCRRSAGQLSASTDADRLGFGASVLLTGLPGLLDVLARS